MSTAKQQQDNDETIIPDYISLQFIANHIENEIANNSPDLLPDALRWRKVLHLANKGYLGRYPGYFLDGSLRNEEYLTKLLTMDIISQGDELYDSSNLGLSNGFGVNINKKQRKNDVLSAIENDGINNNNNNNNTETEDSSRDGLTFDNNHDMNGPRDSDPRRRSSLFCGIEGDYYLHGNINWNAKAINSELDNIKASFKIKDLSLPCKIAMPKTESKYELSLKENTVSTELIENALFSIYPRGNNKGSFLTIPLDSYVTPLLCIFYYEVEIIEGIVEEADIVIGFIKEEIKNVAYSSSAMVDMRGSDDRVIGWYGKNGFMTVWNDKRMEKKVCKFGRNDVVGIGYNLYKDVFFITKNGFLITEIVSVDRFLEKSFDGKKNVRGLVPAISLGSWCGAKINLGDREKDHFKFNIVNYLKDSKMKLRNEIESDEITPFQLPNHPETISNCNVSTFVDFLVMGYLKYGGYTDTIKAMENDLSYLNRETFCDNGISGSPKHDQMLELGSLKKQIKNLIFYEKFQETRKHMESAYPGFFTTYRKIDFRLRVLCLIKVCKEHTNGTMMAMKLASQLKHLFKEEECQYYIDQISVIFSYEDIRKCPQFNQFYEDGKNRIFRAILMAINEQNDLPFISSLDLLILKTDQNLEASVEEDADEDRRKSSLLMSMLEDYIKY